MILPETVIIGEFNSLIYAKTMQLQGKNRSLLRPLTLLAWLSLQFCFI